MNKNAKVVAGVIVVIVVVVAVAAFALFHTSNNPAPATTNSSNQNQSNSSTPAVNNAVLTTKTDSSLGQYLADSSGKPLYTYNADSSGKSNCTGICLANWPAYQAKGSTANLPSGVGVITRSDNGQKQYTYNGMPLYYFIGDSNGQVTGNGVQNFTIAKPAAATSSSSSSTSPSSSSSSPTPPSSGSSSGYPY
ncbi:MAG TPA: hypothetical protein VGG13_02895 [Candidatus Saccharimonadales bacterium]|jgi:predicted lipoprotein with Yx(FWY)xxD motif